MSFNGIKCVSLRGNSTEPLDHWIAGRFSCGGDDSNCCTPKPVHSRIVQVTATNVDIASVAPTYHLYTKEEIEEVVSRL